MKTMAVVKQSDLRCTEAVLNAFGVFGIAPRDGGGVLEALVAHGYGYSMVDEDFHGQTLQSFVSAHPTGRYYLFTAGHALALIDGHLTDTEDKGPNGRRLQGAYKITQGRTAAADTVLLYHGTTSVDGEKILTQGLKPGVMKPCYLSDNFTEASGYAIDRSGIDYIPVVLEAHIPRKWIDEGKLTQGGWQGSWASYEKIPARFFGDMVEAEG